MLYSGNFYLCQQLGGYFTQALENFWSYWIFFFLRFPLYPKGGEKLQFDYGVYLLNKNIAQVSNLSSLLFYFPHTTYFLDCWPSFFINKYYYSWLFYLTSYGDNVKFFFGHSLILRHYKYSWEAVGAHWNPSKLRSPLLSCYLLVDCTWICPFITFFL